jgi:hypothetical protein
MQFQVPQFIEIEDKIFGPLTLKQFIYIAGGVGAVIAIYIYIPSKILAIIIGLPIIAFSVALAFYKKNGKSFIDIVEAGFYYYIGEKLYIWKKVEKKPENNIVDEIQKAKSMVSVPKMSESKLKDLTWSLDIKESLNPVTKEEE